MIFTLFILIKNWLVFFLKLFISFSSLLNALTTLIPLKESFACITKLSVSFWTSIIFFEELKIIKNKIIEIEITTTKNIKEILVSIKNAQIKDPMIKAGALKTRRIIIATLTWRRFTSLEIMVFKLPLPIISISDNDKWVIFLNNWFLNLVP